jgi:hypothetical protein
VTVEGVSQLTPVNAGITLVYPIRHTKYLSGFSPVALTGLPVFKTTSVDDRAENASEFCRVCRSSLRTHPRRSSSALPKMESIQDEPMNRGVDVWRYADNRSVQLIPSVGGTTVTSLPGIF